MGISRRNNLFCFISPFFFSSHLHYHYFTNKNKTRKKNIKIQKSLPYLRPYFLFFSTIQFRHEKKKSRVIFFFFPQQNTRQKKYKTLSKKNPPFQQKNKNKTKTKTKKYNTHLFFFPRLHSYLTKTL